MSARGACIGHKREYYKTAELIEELGCAQISRIGSYTFEGNTCACTAVCERTAGQELNPLLLLITPRLCNFRPAMVVGITFFAVRLRDFCSCLLLIMWHNKLPRNIEI